MIIVIDHSKEKIAALLRIEEKKMKGLREFVGKFNLKEWKNAEIGKKRKFLPKLVEIIEVYNISIIEGRDLDEIAYKCEMKLRTLKKKMPNITAIVDDEITKRFKKLLRERWISRESYEKLFRKHLVIPADWIAGSWRRNLFKELIKKWGNVHLQ